jgi:p-hydroxybenzoate 3-monooxygenase
MRTQVVIIGSGPSGLLLGQLLANSGIDNVILERVDRDYVLGRVRAGVLEQGMVDLLDDAGAGARMRAEGLPHEGISLAFDNRLHRIDLAELTGGKRVTVYGQTEVTHDLMDKREAEGLTTVYDAKNVMPHGFDSDAPYVTYEKDGAIKRIDCDFIAGCDGFHGISRKSAPEGAIKTYERAYPFGWLGILAEVPPADHELIYANHPSAASRCARCARPPQPLLCPVPARRACRGLVGRRFWDELRRRLPSEAAERVSPAVAREKSIAPLRSFVAEPMRFGRLFLAGDAAHIVPPTGAKGLNLAASDVRYLCRRPARVLSGAFAGRHRRLFGAGAGTRLEGRALLLVDDHLLHRFPENDDFGQRIQRAELDYLVHSQAASAALAENYVGLPY